MATQVVLLHLPASTLNMTETPLLMTLVVEVKTPFQGLILRQDMVKVPSVNMILFDMSLAA